MDSKLVSVMIYTQTKSTKDGKKKFKVYSTKYNFLMEDGTRSSKYIRVNFTSDAFDDSQVKEKDITRGLLLVDKSKIGCPDVYEIKTDDNGNKIYPECWIRGGIIEFKEIKKEHEFHFDVNEQETEESEIGE